MSTTYLATPVSVDRRRVVENHGDSDTNISWGVDSVSRSERDQAVLDAQFQFQWNIQVTCILLIGAVGIFILAVFLVSLYCGRKAFRKMEINIMKPSRLKAIWTNVRIVNLRPAVLFQRGPSSGANLGGASTQETVSASDYSPIVNTSKHQSITEDISEYQDAVEDQDPEGSSVCGDGFATPCWIGEDVRGLREFPPQQNHLQVNESSNDQILYKVITI